MVTKIEFVILTAEREVYRDEVDMVIAPGIDGELGILPNHTPLMTALQPGGELRVRKDGEDYSMFVSGGFLDVMGGRVTVLADTAEREEEIDAARAEEAKRRAEERLAKRAEVDAARAEAALRRSLMRLRVAEKRRRRGTGSPESR